MGENIVDDKPDPYTATPPPKLPTSPHPSPPPDCPLARDAPMSRCQPPCSASIPASLWLKRERFSSLHQCRASRPILLPSALQRSHPDAGRLSRASCRCLGLSRS